MREDHLEVDIPLVNNFDQRETIGFINIKKSFAERIARESFSGSRYVLGICTNSDMELDPCPLLFTLTAEPYNQESPNLTPRQKEELFWERDFGFPMPKEWKARQMNSARRLFKQGIVYYNSMRQTIEIEESVKWRELQTYVPELKTLGIL